MAASNLCMVKVGGWYVMLSIVLTEGARCSRTYCWDTFFSQENYGISKPFFTVTNWDIFLVSRKTKTLKKFKVKEKEITNKPTYFYRWRKWFLMKCCMWWNGTFIKIKILTRPCFCFTKPGGPFVTCLSFHKNNCIS